MKEETIRKYVARRCRCPLIYVLSFSELVNKYDEFAVRVVIESMVVAECGAFGNEIRYVYCCNFSNNSRRIYFSNEIQDKYLDKYASGSAYLYVKNRSIKSVPGSVYLKHRLDGLGVKHIV